MIKTFDTNISTNTTSTGSSGSTSGSGSTKQIITVIVLCAVAYLGYKFVYKPMMDKKNNDTE
jgi:hypothetical protein